MNTHNLFFSSRLSLSNHPHESVRRPKPIFEGGEAERRQDGPCPFAEAARELVVKIWWSDRAGGIPQAIHYILAYPSRITVV